jgi:hypothetical protein
MIDPSRGMPQHIALHYPRERPIGAKAVERPPSKERAVTAIRLPRRLALQDFEERLCPFEPRLAAGEHAADFEVGDGRFEMNDQPGL